MRATSLILLASIVLAVTGPSADAALIMYEGFPAGGDAPAAGQYQSDPDSTDGTNNDSLGNQGPAGVGFAAGTNWVLNDQVATVIYPRVLDVGLGYTDSYGNVLQTVQGAADWHRGNSTNTQGKLTTRATSLSPPLPETGYFSALLQFTSGAPGQIELVAANDLDQNRRALFFGFTSGGNLTAGTISGTPGTVTSSAAFAPDVTYLLFGEVVNDASSDNLRIWVNPADLNDPMAGVPVIDSSNIGSGWPAGLLDYTMRELRLRVSSTGQFSQVIFDEIRLGSTPQDVLPIAAIPEPASATLSALGLLGLGLFARRRRRRS